MQQFFSRINGKVRAGRAQGHNLAFFVRQREEVAVARLPGVFAGLLNRLCVPASDISQRCEHVALAAKHHFALMLNRLDRQEGVTGILVDLPPNL